MTDATEQNTLPESDGAQAPTATPERVDESGRSEQSGRGKQVPGPGEQFEVRAGKRERLRGEGWDPYPVRLPITTTIAAVRERYGHLQAGEETQDVVGLAGRVVFLRNTGRLCFVTLADGAGTTLQAMLSAKALPAEGHTCLAAFKSDVDLGDHLFVHGRVISRRATTAPGRGGRPGWGTTTPPSPRGASAPRPCARCPRSGPTRRARRSA